MILAGDVLDVLPTLDAESVHCVVTSPPYWGLRDYGTAVWAGGDAECDHKVGRFERGGLSAKQASNNGSSGDAARADCPKCGAVRVDSQLGLEPTPEAWLERMVEVFREVRRVLRSDGTVWLNIGDSYAHSTPGGGSVFDNGRTDGRTSYEADKARGREKVPTLGPGLKPKDLILMPARLALALQADGWWLRSDIIWSKPNPMPESVTDRPTSAHEHVFLLTKAARYFYDADAVRETSSPNTHSRGNGSSPKNELEAELTGRHKGWGESTTAILPERNLRNVWSIATEPFPEAHFATYPKRLVEPCIKAGTSERGCCAECGAPWEREVERTPDDRVPYATVGAPRRTPVGGHQSELPRVLREDGKGGDLARARVRTTGWRPTCTHDSEPVPCTVLDPFAGSGTTGVVAAHLGREFVGIELSPEYAAMAERRIANWRREYATSPAPKVLEGQEGLW